MRARLRERVGRIRGRAVRSFGLSMSWSGVPEAEGFSLSSAAPLSSFFSFDSAMVRRTTIPRERAVRARPTHDPLGRSTASIAVEMPPRAREERTLASMYRRHLFLSFLVTIAMLLASLGCKSKASLDADVDHLLVAISTSDYDHFKADAHPALAKELSKEQFDRMAKVLKGLGPLKTKSMKSISVKAGAPSEGHYEMQFANGSATLEIKSLDGKLVGFNFNGPDVTRLSRGQ